MPYQWAVKCKDCGKEFTFQLIDENHPRQAVNDMPKDKPAKPPFRRAEEKETCPHCGNLGSYQQSDLEFRTA